MLGFGVDDVGVLGIDPGGEAVSAGRDEPVALAIPWEFTVPDGPQTELLSWVPPHTR